MELTNLLQKTKNGLNAKIMQTNLPSNLPNQLTLFSTTGELPCFLPECHEQEITIQGNLYTGSHILKTSDLQTYLCQLIDYLTNEFQPGNFIGDDDYYDILPDTICATLAIANQLNILQDTTLYLIALITKYDLHHKTKSGEHIPLETILNTNTELLQAILR